MIRARTDSRASRNNRCTPDERAANTEVSIAQPLDSQPLQNSRLCQALASGIAVGSTRYSRPWSPLWSLWFILHTPVTRSRFIPSLDNPIALTGLFVLIDTFHRNIRSAISVKESYRFFFLSFFLLFFLFLLRFFITISFTTLEFWFVFHCCCCIHETFYSLFVW